jgi:hypothetical protein
VLIIPSSWGSQLGGHLHAINRCRQTRASTPTSTSTINRPPPLRGVASFTRSSSPSSRTDVPGCRRAASQGAGCHVHARSLSHRRVLPRLLRVPPPRLYMLRAWPLLAISVPAASPSSLSTTTSSPASSPRPRPVYFDNSGWHRHLSSPLYV